MFLVRGPSGARRRALALAVGAWRGATERSDLRCQLVVVGSERPPAEDGVVYLGRLEDAEWAAVLAGASAFCYPSRYEGFGMPVLKAAASGTPVACAGVGPVPRCWEIDAEWAAITEVGDMARALNRLLSDPDRQGELRTSGLKRASESPTRADGARWLADVYAAAASG